MNNIVISDHDKKIKNYDTLPNGKFIFDMSDSSGALYYKEIVGPDTLKGGSITCYGMDDSMRYFYLRNGNVLHLLNQSSKYQSPVSLGILEKDFDTFFITVIDNGNSYPSSYQVFEKKDGRNILGQNVTALDYKLFQNELFLLYNNSSPNKKSGNLTLFNVNTRAKKTYESLENLPDFCGIEIEKLSDKNLILSFSSYVGENFEMLKTYKR